MGMTAIEEESSPPRIEGGPGEGGASTRAPSGARRAPTAADEAPYPSYDANDDPTMTAVRWTNDVDVADKDDATGPPALPMGTSTMVEGRGRRSRLVVDVGSISASRRRRVADESSNTTPARFRRRTTSLPTRRGRAIADHSPWSGRSRRRRGRGKASRRWNPTSLSEEVSPYELVLARAVARAGRHTLEVQVFDAGRGRRTRRGGGRGAHPVRGTQHPPGLRGRV